MTKLFLFLLPFLSLCSSQKPNIVLMVADDLGWADVPWNGALAIAPTLAELASSGVILDRHYVQHICTPTRAALMTGKYPSRLGLQHLTISAGKPYGLDKNETLLSNHMQDLGYAVHGVGKWHLGYCSWDLTPVKRGFDSFYGFYNGHETYYTKKTHGCYDFRLNTPDKDGEVNDTIIWNETAYSNELYAARASQVISTHDQDKPLFLYVPMQSVHSPSEVPDEYVEMYDDVQIEKRKRKRLLAMVTAMDDTAQVVVGALKDAGMWDNTIFIFFSDNGGPAKGHSIGQSNYPLRGAKYSYWEGGIRSASFVHSPLLPNTGVVNTELLHVTDWLPTLTYLGACGASDTTGTCQGPLLGDVDGVNQWSAITGAGASNRTEFLVNINQKIGKGGNAGLRMGPWKLLQGVMKSYNTALSETLSHLSPGVLEEDEYEEIINGATAGSSSQVQLYNVETDPSETDEVSSAHPDVVQRMLARLEYHKGRAVRPRNCGKDKDSDPTKFGGVWTPWLDSC